MALPGGSAGELLCRIGGANKIARVFDLIGVVEEEIAMAKKDCPQREAYFDESFMMFSNEATPFMEYDLELWRYHVHELMGRLANPDLTKPERELGTIAEAMVGFSEASLIHPLDSDATAAFSVLFEMVYGKEKMEYLFGRAEEKRYESYPGAMQELISWARKKTGHPRSFPTAQDIQARVQEDIRRGNPVKGQYQLAMQLEEV